MLSGWNRVIVVYVAAFAALVLAATPCIGDPREQEGGSRVIRIPMRLVNASAAADSAVGTRVGLMFEPLPASKLARRGHLTVDGTDYSIYLPASASYSARNTGKGDKDNTSALLLIDENHDGQLTLDESRYASLPLRIGDRMFSVKRIAADGSLVEMVPSTEPLQSLVVGRRCPAILYEALSDEHIDSSSLKNKAFIIDVWSFT